MKTILPLSVIILLISQTSFAKTYYFSTNSGSDSRDSVQAQNPSTPWKNIDKLNSYFKSLFPGDSVLFKRGETFIGTIITDTSGNFAQRIVIGAYGTGNKPVISGFQDMTFDIAFSNIYTSHEVLGLPRYKLNLVTQNGTPVAMGRYPQTGYRIITRRGMTSSGSTNRVGTGYIIDSLLPSLPDWTDGELVDRTQRWRLDKGIITHHYPDKDSFRITVQYLGSNLVDTPQIGAGYFIQNNILTLTYENAWYYSPSGNLMWFSRGPAPTGVKAASVNQLVTCKNAYITFDSLSFEGANDTCVYVNGATGVSFKYCDFNNIGGTAIASSGDTTNVLNCSITNCLDNGVAFSSSPSTQGDSVLNCYLADIQTITGGGKTGDKDGFGIGLFGKGQTASNNILKRMGMTGIYAYKNNNLTVTHNSVDTFNMIKDDDGAFYWYGDDASFDPINRRCDSNIALHGMFSSAAGTTIPTVSRAYCFYADVNTFKTTFKGNTAAFSYGGFFIHKASDITLTYNTAYECDHSIQMNNEDSGSKRNMLNCVVTNNIMFARSPEQYTYWVNFWNGNTSINAIGRMDSNYHVSPFSNNNMIIYDEHSKVSMSLSTWVSAHSSVHYDLHSHLSPKTFATQTSLDSSVRFEYNATDADKSISLGGYNYIGVDSMKYLQKIILKPYTSIILIRDTNVVLNPLADAYVRDGADSNSHYGTDTSLQVKKNNAAGYNDRSSYLKFSVGNLSGVSSAKLRLYGKNTTDTSAVNISAYGVANNSWTETGITWNNKPAISGSALDSVSVDTAKYYEFDVTSFVKTQLLTDTVSFIIKDTTHPTLSLLSFNSRENVQFPPQLVIVTPVAIGPLADSYVRDDTASNNTHGSSDSLQVKKNNAPGNPKNDRISYLKFSVSHFNNVNSAKLRIYGKNTTDTSAVKVSAYGVTDTSWTETGITWSNKPAISGSALDSVSVDTAKYYEFDVTSFVKAQLSTNIVSFIIKDTSQPTASLLSFNSKEKGQYPPQLIIDQSGMDSSYPRGRRGTNSGNNHSVPTPNPLKVTSNTFDKAFLTAKVYPNPAQKSFILAFPNYYKEDFSLQMMDQLGRIWNLGKQKLYPNESYIMIDIERLALPPGIYYLKINYETRKNEVIKVMIR